MPASCRVPGNQRPTCYTPPITVDDFLLINSYLPAWAAAVEIGAARMRTCARSAVSLAG